LRGMENSPETREQSPGPGNHCRVFARDMLHLQPPGGGRIGGEWQRGPAELRGSHPSAKRAISPNRQVRTIRWSMLDRPSKSPPFGFSPDAFVDRPLVPRTDGPYACPIVNAPDGGALPGGAALALPGVSAARPRRDLGMVGMGHSRGPNVNRFAPPNCRNVTGEHSELAPGLGLG